MKLYEIEIKNMRGIKDITLHPNGKNFVVWGFNGAGKSAVVDAIDFLLTGRISRLMGQGTANITLQKHGAHVDCSDPKAAYVRATIKINGSNKPIEIKRSVDKPGDLFISPKDKKSLLKPVLEIAQRGQHVLTRREILRFITAEGGKRAKDIQSLMNLSEIEDIRTTLVQISHKLEKKLAEAKGKINNAIGLINSLTQTKEFDEERLLEIINKNRALLNGQPLNKVSSSSIKSDLKPPAVLASDKEINTTVFERDISNLLSVLSDDAQKEFRNHDAQLREMVLALHEDAELLNSFSTQQLTRQGLRLINESGKCPLCDTPWKPGALKAYLLNKLKNAEVTEERINQLEKTSTLIDIRASAIISSLSAVIDTTHYIGLEKEENELGAWKKRLEVLKKILSDPVSRYHKPPFKQEEVGRLLAYESVKPLLEDVLKNVKDNYPESTPEQTAWDILNKLEEPLKSLEETKRGYEEANLFYRRAQILKNEYLKARDNVLGKLYEDIKDRFVELYRELHHIDEKSFDASLKPQEASLEFEVDFYGRGNHPPHALHSEGHQDSMGLCLFLALSEKLTENLIDLIVLDDVVMSVDAEHRRELCHILSKNYPDRQFLITTHDRVWANQLRSEGVVETSGSIEFFDWNIKDGPKVNEAVEIWGQIEDDLTKGDISAASALLRHGAEQFFAEVCDRLHAPVEYRLNGKYELGDYLFAAMGKFKELLKLAKFATQSWEGDKSQKEEIQILEYERKETYAKLGDEQWAVNVNVHYNEWADFCPNDFRPVVDAFKNLFDLFICKRCNSILRLVLDGKEPLSVRCNCGKVNWNLVKKKSTGKTP